MTFRESTSRHATLQHVCIGNVTIETIVEGKGPALVILPSYGRDGLEDYDETSAYLVQAGWKVLRPQPRGTATSIGPMRGLSMHDLGADIAHVIEVLGDGSAIVLGHAFGNFVARALATDRPELVTGVILASAQAAHVPDEVARAPFVAADLSKSEGERLAALRLAFFAPAYDASKWLKGWYPETLAMQREALGAADLKSFWAAGSAPLLEIIPDHDPFKAKVAWQELRDQLGGRVTTRVIADASHALFPEQPKAVSAAISSWGNCLIASRPR